MLIYIIGAACTLLYMLFLGLHKYDEHPMWALVILLLTWPGLYAAIVYMVAYKALRGKEASPMSVAIPYILGNILTILFYLL